MGDLIADILKVLFGVIFIGLCSTFIIFVIRILISRLSLLRAAEKVVEEAREYTRTRMYYSREACVKDLDRLEKLLISAIHAYDALKRKEATDGKETP